MKPIVVKMVKSCKYGGMFLTSIAGICISGYGIGDRSKTTSRNQGTESRLDIYNY